MSTASMAALVAGRICFPLLSWPSRTEAAVLTPQRAAAETQDGAFVGFGQKPFFSTNSAVWLRLASQRTAFGPAANSHACCHASFCSGSGSEYDGAM